MDGRNKIYSERCEPELQIHGRIYNFKVTPLFENAACPSFSGTYSCQVANGEVYSSNVRFDISIEGVPIRFQGTFTTYSVKGDVSRARGTLGAGDDGVKGTLSLTRRW